MIKILFFDADGTLWYPKKTKRESNPKWIHRDTTIHDVRKHLMLAPDVFSTLSKLKKTNIKLVVLSVSPLPAKKAKERLVNNLNHFKILKFFDNVYATQVYVESKGEHILKILKRYHLKKSEALMIGDIYAWDFSSASKVGVKCFLFEHRYDPQPHQYNKVKTKLKDFKDILKIV